MSSRLIIMAIVTIALLGVAVGGGTLLGRSLDTGPLPAVRAHVVSLPNSQVAEGRFPLNFQGILLDENGDPVSNSSHSVTFAIYDDEAKRGALWSETQTVFTLDGLFTVELGVEKDIDPSIFSENPETFLGVQVGRNTELTPRIRLAYAPYAIHALTADNALDPPVNPRRVALNRWYQANQSGLTVVVDDSPTVLTFDGNSIWVITRGNKDQNDDDNATKIDPRSGSKILEVDVGRFPQDITFDGRHVWVVNRDDNSITRFRPDGSSLRTLPIDSTGKFDDDVLDRPSAIAFDGTFIWVANQGNDSVTRIITSDIEEQELLKSIENLEDEIDELEEEIEDLEDDGDPDSKIPDIEDRIEDLEDRIDNLEDFIEARFQEFSVGVNPSDIAFDGENLWVLHTGRNNVTKINASDGEIIESLSVGSGQAGIAFDGEHMWVVDRDDETVTKVRVSDGEEIGTFDVGIRPVAIAFDGEAMWVVNSGSNTVTKLRVSDGKLLGTFNVGENPAGIAFDGANLWVSNQDNDTVEMK